MRGKKLISWGLSLVMALTVFCIPVGGVYADDEWTPAEGECCIGIWDEDSGTVTPIKSGDSIDYSQIGSNELAVCRYYGDDGWDLYWSEDELYNWTKTEDPDGVANVSWWDDASDETVVSSDPGFTTSDPRIRLLPMKAGIVELKASFKAWDWDSDDDDIITLEASIKINVSEENITYFKYERYLDYGGMDSDYSDKAIYVWLEDLDDYNDYAARYGYFPLDEADVNAIKVTATFNGNVLAADVGPNEYGTIIIPFPNCKVGNKVTLTFEAEGVQIEKSVTVYQWVKPKVTFSNFTYNGKVRKPSFTVKVGKTTLKENVDYYVEVNGRKSVGRTKYSIWNKWDAKYRFDDIEGYFKVNPKGTSLTKLQKGKKQITVKWNKQAAKMATSVITGYQIQLATNKTFTKNKKLVTVKGYKNVSKKVKKLKKKKTYYVRIRTYKTVGGVNFYSPWSKVKSVKTK